MTRKEALIALRDAVRQMNDLFHRHDVEFRRPVLNASARARCRNLDAAAQAIKERLQNAGIRLGCDRNGLFFVREGGKQE
jgi:hypothetical protein